MSIRIISEIEGLVKYVLDCKTKRRDSQSSL
jgi:hypothetical protein